MDPRIEKFLSAKHGQAYEMIIACPYREWADALLEFADKCGWRWVSGLRATDHNNWEAYGSQTCYRFDKKRKTITCSPEGYYAAEYTTPITPFEGPLTPCSDTELCSLIFGGDISGA